jgi:hypothetical protein
MPQPRFLSRARLTGLACVALAVIPHEGRTADPTIIFTGVVDAVNAVKTYYSIVDWANCYFGTTCAETDAQQAADRVIGSIGALNEAIDTDRMIGDFRALNLRTYRDYTSLSLSSIEETNLLNTAEQLWSDMDVKLNGTHPAVKAEVDAAYRLAPFYNILAALLDHIARTALAHGRVPVDYNVINIYRSTTLATDYALIGAQSLWYQCPQSGGYTMVDTTQSIQSTAEWAIGNSLNVKKLWREFSDYKYEDVIFEKTPGTCANNCDVFRVTSPNAVMCSFDCNNFLHLCSACAIGFNEEHYPYEVPKILSRMNRDGAVRTIRAAMEQLEGLSSLQGSGVLWLTPSGELDLSILSATSYKAFPLGTTDPAAWQPIGTGDFNGDGVGDVLWHDTTYGYLSVWDLKGTQVTAMTPAVNRGAAGIAYVGDLNGDGLSDIVWSSTSATIPPYRMTTTWLMNPGSTIPRSISVTSSPTDVVQGVGVFNRVAPDPDPTHHASAQILFRSQTTGEVSIVDLYGGRVSLGPVSSDWVVKWVGQLNADQTTNILWYNTSSGEVSIWAVRGDQIARNSVPGSSAPAAGWTPLALADVDHDGAEDIVWRHTSGAITVWMLYGWGTVRQFGQAVSLNPASKFAGVVVMGPPAPANAPSPIMTDQYCGISTGELRNPAFANYETWWWDHFDGGYGTMLGDVDGDGKADLVSIGAGYVGALRSTGKAFGAYEQALPYWFWGSHGTFLGDVDGDGRADLVALGDTYIAVRRSAQRHSATFGNYETWWSNLFDGGYGTMLGDIDGDGKADLVGIGAGYVGVLRSTGTAFGAYETGLPYWFWGSHGTFLGDVDGDGKADLVALGDGYIAVRRATGNSSQLFGNYETWLYGTFYGSRRTFLGDVDGDGRADLVAIYDDHVSVMRSTGSAFGRAEIWFGGTFYGNTFLGDVDGNSRADLVGIGNGAGTTNGVIDVIRSQ